MASDCAKRSAVRSTKTTRATCAERVVSIILIGRNHSGVNRESAAEGQAPSGVPSVLVDPGRIASTDLVDGTHMRTCPGLLRIAEIAGTVLVSHSIVSAVSKLRLGGFIFGAVLI